MAKKLTATDRKALIRLASTMAVGSPERRAILAGLKRGGRSDAPSPEIQKLNVEFYKGLSKSIPKVLQDAYLDDPEDGLALWIEESGGDRKGLRALREEIISNLDSALEKLAPIARDINNKIKGL